MNVAKNVLPTIVLILILSFKVNASEPCEKQLLALRYFRGETNYSEVGRGFYTLKDGRLYFSSDQPSNGKKSDIQTVFFNSATHRAILQRQVGAERYQAIMHAIDPASALTEVIQQQAVDMEAPENILDAEEVKDEIEAFPVTAALPKSLEDKVFALFKQMGRLASPMEQWLYPKWKNHLLRQLPADQMDDPIASYIRPNVFVYKALLVTVRLSEEKTFIISGGQSGLPDSVHALLIGALRMSIPNHRILQTVPGYLVITQMNRENTAQGKIEFLPKGPAKRPLAFESFDFGFDP